MLFLHCRYREGHAVRHFEASQHCYSLELETQRVWDYVGDNYVHRLIQSKTDGKLVELPAPSHEEEGDGSHGGSGGRGGRGGEGGEGGGARAWGEGEANRGQQGSGACGEGTSSGRGAMRTWTRCWWKARWSQSHLSTTIC